jgi:hypothetical protein
VWCVAGGCGSAVFKERAGRADYFAMLGLDRSMPTVRLPRRNQAGQAEDVGGTGIAAVMVERNDGTCTILWAGAWRSFSSRSEWWPTRRDAMHAVERVTGEVIIWSETASRTWTARAA